MFRLLFTGLPRRYGVREIAFGWNFRPLRVVGFALLVNVLMSRPQKRKKLRGL